ncbi:glyoxalase family protein [Trichoderma harzianum]|uniref:Glyoxalase family protein n=1 Tax=Trichoderma harzianum TaxID=5544 RepID=A0A0F9XQM9_TRIHA|nr:glyoxalase family protein [Trichoderma harzianum]
MPKVSITRIAHVYYRYRDLDKAHSFLLDFGMIQVDRRQDRIYYRGYGTEPFVFCAEKANEDEFAGAAFAVDTFEDLELAASLGSGSTIRDLDAPGGGKIVSLQDPTNKIPFHFIHGQSHTSYDANKEDRGTRPFNYLVHDETGRDVATFLHLDRGKEMVDHHSFFFYEGPKPHVHHSSFEIHDLDTRALGHDWLIEQGHEICWGVGRHVLGSQIFDYWYDSAKFIMEHYIDGDLVNSDTPVAKSKLGKDGLSVWGPDVPLDFLT